MHPVGQHHGPRHLPHSQRPGRSALHRARGHRRPNRWATNLPDAILITTPGGVQRIAIGLITDHDLASLPQ